MSVLFFIAVCDTFDFFYRLEKTMVNNGSIVDLITWDTPSINFDNVYIGFIALLQVHFSLV